MTVVVGFVGSDGAVMVSDSQASEQDKTKYDIPKIWEDNGLLFGYSGNTAVRDPLQIAIHEKLDGRDTSSLRWSVRTWLIDAMKPVLKREYANYIPQPPQGQVPTALAGSLLVLGRDENGFWLLDIDYSLVGTFHPERGFHAVGSGSAAAQVARGLLEHYDPGTRDLRHLRLIAYRTVQTCIRVLDAQVGGEIQLWARAEDGGFECVQGEDLRDVAHGVDQWATIERESLQEVFGEPLGDEGEAEEVGLPEQLGDEPEPLGEKPEGAPQPEQPEPEAAPGAERPGDDPERS